MTIADRRLFFRSGLNDLYLPSYDKLCAALDDSWQPYQSTRSFEAQDHLWAQGRTTSGGIVTNARGGESAHCYGAASDWTIFNDGAPEWLHPSDVRWVEYQEAVEACGLRWGGEFDDVDHNELKISVNWTQVHEVFLKQGMDGAMAYIKTVLEV